MRLPMGPASIPCSSGMVLRPSYAASFCLTDTWGQRAQGWGEGQWKVACGLGHGASSQGHPQGSSQARKWRHV